MKIKQLMLGTACAALAATGVQAADLSQPEAAAADYVRVCDAHGAGFFYIPGTETCMRIQGRVRVEYGASSIDSKLTKAEKRMKDRMTFASKAYIYVDARTELDSGPLKSFFEYQMGESSPAKAYISGLGGFTMGKAGSRYDFKTGYSYGTVGYKVSDTGGAIVLAYNASLGNGLSVDFSIEDGKSRRNGGNYGGLELPDFVGALTMSQGSVTAKLSGALHQNRSSDASVSTKIGYGVSGGAEVDLGAAKVAMQAQYTIGATSYAGFANDDFSVVAGKIKQNRAWSVWGGLEVGLGDGLTSYTDLSYGKFDDKGNKANDYTFWSVSETIEASLGAGMLVGGDIGYSSTKTRGLKRKNVFAGKVRFQQTF